MRTISLADYPRPHGILFLKGQQKVAVSCEGADSVVIANIHTGKIEQVISTQQKGSHMVALPASSKFVYTPNMGANSISEMNIDTGKLTRIIPAEEVPEAITINQLGTELWVGSNKAGYVTVYDVTTGKAIKQWRGYEFPYRILLTQDQQFAVIPDFKKDTLDIINVLNKQKVRVLTFRIRLYSKWCIFPPK